MLPYARILVVDDNRVARKIVRNMLESAGHPSIDEAAGGEAALGLLARRRYVLVISDANMTPMSGLQLLTTMRASPALRSVPFVMVTAPSQKRFSGVARDLGATRYIEKPFDAKALMRCIASISGSTAAA